MIASSGRFGRLTSRSDSEPLPFGVARYLCLLFDAYNPETTASQLLKLLAELEEKEHNDFPNLRPCRTPIPSLAPDSDPLALHIARQQAAGAIASPRPKRIWQSVGTRSAGFLLLGMMICVLVVAAAAICMRAQETTAVRRTRATTFGIAGERSLGAVRGLRSSRGRATLVLAE